MYYFHFLKHTILIWGYIKISQCFQLFFLMFQFIQSNKNISEFCHNLEIQIYFFQLILLFCSSLG